MESNLPRVPICKSSLPSAEYFWTIASALPATKTLPRRSTKQPWIELGTVAWSPHDPTTLPSVSNLMIDGAEVEVSFSSSVISRRLTTKMWSCPPRQTPPSCPVIQSFGSGFGQDASIANCGASCACSTDGGTTAANKRAIAFDTRLAINFTAALSLFKFFAAEVHRLECAHVGDVLERVLRQDQEVG